MNLADKNSWQEWLEPDGLGGFASGTACGVRTRRYHALLLAAVTPPTGRQVLVAGLEAVLETRAGRFSLSTNEQATGITGGIETLESFTPTPWPQWSFRLPDRTQVRFELFVARGSARVFLSWRLAGKRRSARLFVRPLFAGRDYHALKSAGSCEEAHTEGAGQSLTFHLGPGTPPVSALCNGELRPEREWHRGFLYREERARGFDHTEDLLCLGELAFDLERGPAALVLGVSPFMEADAALPLLAHARTRERRQRARFPSPMHRAAEAYVVSRGEGLTLIAGYPWFTDWGRDTFISLRGLCLATRHFDEARRILLAWTSAVSQGMLPNRFPDQGEAPDYNSVDASLWFVVAVQELLARAAVSEQDRRLLVEACAEIVSGYARGTRFGIACDGDGLLRAGLPGTQLTWMDAKVGDWVVTPRVGKPVEVQALWLNALSFMAEHEPRWRELLHQAERSFAARFWNQRTGYLFDVVDAGHVSKGDDDRLRPNQIFAVGGLPRTLLDEARARSVVDAVEARLWTPAGLRSLAPDHPDYVTHYVGDARARDGAYHQGTVWPFLAGAFVEAWVRVRGNTSSAKREARRRFLMPLLLHLDPFGSGHLPEIADGDPPHTARGCPFQAWSVAEALRLSLEVLGEGSDTSSKEGERGFYS